MANSLWPISALRLDDKNPRLPPSIQGKSQSDILKYLFDKGSLEELAHSFVDNGFFPHEPLAILAMRRMGSTSYLRGTVVSPRS